MKKHKQVSLDFPTPRSKHGGRRAGAGRKPKGPKALLSHSARPALSRRHPVHVTIRLLAGIPSLRKRRMYIMIQRAFLRANTATVKGGGAGGFRLCHYSVQSNHLHIVCEAKSRQALSRGMQGLSIRLSKGINRLANRKGRVFTDRYHARALTSPRHVRMALRYVLNNLRKHAAEHKERLSRGFVDPYSSGVAFDGWREPWATRRCPKLEPGVVAAAHTWLLSCGWRKAGLIGVAELPGSTSSS